MEILSRLLGECISLAMANAFIFSYLCKMTLFLFMVTETKMILDETFKSFNRQAMEKFTT